MLSSHDVVSSSEARSNFSELLDTAETQPVFVKRKRDFFVTLSLQQLKAAVPFTLVVNRDDAQPFVYFSEIPEVVGFGDSLSELIESFTEGLKGYTKLFMAKFQQSVADPIQKERLLQVLLLSKMTDQEIEVFIRAKLEGFGEIFAK